MLSYNKTLNCALARLLNNAVTNKIAQWKRLIAKWPWQSTYGHHNAMI